MEQLFGFYSERIITDVGQYKISNKSRALLFDDLCKVYGNISACHSNSSFVFKNGLLTLL